MADPLEKGLPVSAETERFVLGSILLDDSLYLQTAGTISAEDFALEKHRRIFDRMGDLHKRGEKIDRVTVANELMKHGQLESCDGISYLVSLDDGLPRTPNIEGYVRIVRDKALLRKIIFASQGVIDRCIIERDEPSEILGDASKGLLNLSQLQGDDGLRTVASVIQEHGGLQAYVSRSVARTGTPTGFSLLDSMTGGLHPGELIVLAARPAMGKTAMVLNIAAHIAAAIKQRVSIFSLEMSRESLIERLMCSWARVERERYASGHCDKGERERLVDAFSKMGDRILIDDSAFANPLTIHSKVRREQQREGIGLVIVDYLQLMNPEGKRRENRNQDVSELSRGLKILAKDLKVPVIALSQLSRAPELRQNDHRPQLSDLRESGSIEQDADLVGFIYREEVYKPNDPSLHGLAELILAKQREGPTGTVPLIWHDKIIRFENSTYETEPSC